MFVRTEIKLKLIKPIHTTGFTCLWKNKKIFVLYSYIKGYVTWTFIYDAVKTFPSWNDLLYQHGGVTGKALYLINLPVHGAQIELSLIFVACFNCEL